MSAAPSITLLSVQLALVRDGKEHPVQVAGAFDRLTTAEAARACGRTIGELIGDILERQVQLVGAV